MTKAEFIRRVNQDLSFRRLKKSTISHVLDDLFALMKEEIARDNGSFSYPKFGKLVRREKKAAMRRNPKTGEKVLVDKRADVSFRPAMQLKDSLR